MVGFKIAKKAFFAIVCISFLIWGGIEASKEIKKQRTEEKTEESTNENIPTNEQTIVEEETDPEKIDVNCSDNIKINDKYDCKESGKVGFGWEWDTEAPNIKEECIDKVKQYRIQAESSTYPEMTLQRTFENNGNFIQTDGIKDGFKNFFGDNVRFKLIMLGENGEQIISNPIEHNVSKSKDCTDTKTTSMHPEWNENESFIAVQAYTKSSGAYHKYLVSEDKDGKNLTDSQKPKINKNYRVFVPKDGKFKWDCDGNQKGTDEIGYTYIVMKEKAKDAGKDIQKDVFYTKLQCGLLGQTNKHKDVKWISTNSSSIY